MTVNVWEAGKLYPTGAVVQPVTAPPPTGAPIVNPSFESGDSDWTKGTGWTIVNAPADAYQGSWVARFLHNGTTKLTAAVPIAVAPGHSITCTLAVDQGASSAGNAGAQVALAWYDAGLVELSESLGNLIDSGSSGEFKTSTVTAAAPPGAAYVAARCVAFGNGTSPVFVDSFVWNYVSTGLGGLIYKAVQPATGTSGATEPVWPTTLGVQVVDNEVIWEAMAGTRVVWEAHPILESGVTEPTWGLLPDSIAADGTIQWRAYPRVITDTHCPHDRVVLIMEGHVFSPDDDVVRFSAALAPRDWTTESDAGFLNTGMNGPNSSPATGLAPYRKNMSIWSAGVVQLYQMDADPALMVGLDDVPGIGTHYPKTLVPIVDDLLGLTTMGVRSVNISVGGQNLSGGDVGAPIDVLVRRSLAIATANEVEPHAAYWPNLGQYLLAFEGQPVDAVVVTGELPDGAMGEPVVDFTYGATGGVGPKTFALVPGEGTLDPGLTLNPNGTVTGTRAGPPAVYPVQILATDSEGLESEPYDDAAETLPPEYLALLHLDGNLTDETGRVWTNGTTDTAHPKFGTGSAHVLGHLQNLLTDGAALFSAINAAGAVTIDLWGWRDSAGTTAPIICGYWYTDGMRSLNWGLTVGGELALFASSDGSAYVQTAGVLVLPEDAQVHLRLCWDGTTLYQFVNGVLDGSVAFAGPFHINEVLGLNFIVGGNDSTHGVDPVFGWYGWIDEIAIIARCLSTSDFTPPVAPWPNP